MLLIGVLKKGEAKGEGRKERSKEKGEKALK